MALINHDRPQNPNQSSHCAAAGYAFFAPPVRIFPLKGATTSSKRAPLCAARKRGKSKGEEKLGVTFVKGCFHVTLKVTAFAVKGCDIFLWTFACGLTS